MPNPVILAAARLETEPKLYHKAAWADEWVYEPRAKVQQASRYLASRIGQCEFLCHFNDWLLQPGATEIAAAVPLEFVGHFVKVTSTKPNQAPNRDWTGIIVNDAVAYKSNVAMRGIQRIKAYTLEFLLYRKIIHKAKVYHDTKVAEIDWAPTFNLRDSYDRGERQIDPSSRELLGNAHGELDKFGQDLRWNAWKAVQYLIDNYAPDKDNIPWALKGQYESLEQWEDVWPQDQLSFGTILDSLISHKTGYTWYVDVYDYEGSEFVDIRVQTMFGTDFTVGSKTIPANDRQITYSIPTASPGRHVFGSPEFNYAITERYKNIIIQGNRIKVFGTWSITDETLTAAWSLLQEDEYRDCTQVPLVIVFDSTTGLDVLMPDVDACDNYRTKDIFRRVFTAFVVPYPWDGLLGNGLGGDTMYAIPSLLDDGEVDFVGPEGEDGLALYQIEKRFLAYIPFLEGFDYSKAEDDDAFDQRLGSTDTDYRKMLLLVQDPYDGHFIRDERAPESEPYLHPISCEPSKHEFGINVRCSPQHIIAGAGPGDSIAMPSLAGPTFHDPINSRYDNMIDYKKMIGSFFFETDQRPRIVLEGSDDPGALTDLVITVKSCEYWFALANSVIDVDAMGELVTIHGDWAIPNAMRKDKDILEMVAAVVEEWFQVQRQKIRLPINDVGYGTSITPELGMFLKGVDGILVREDVNSVVSGLEFDYRVGASLIETDFLGLSERVDLAETVNQIEQLESTVKNTARLANFNSSE